MGLMKNLETCIEIGEKASKEFVIETNLNAMMDRWDDIAFSFSPFKTSFIIKGFDEVMAVLDEHIANTQAMQFSPFKKPF
jgi:dynein heavy chain